MADKMYICLTTFAGPTASVKRGYVGPIKASTKDIDSWLKAGFIKLAEKPKKVTQRAKKEIL